MHGSLATPTQSFVADDVTGKCSENRNVNAGELLLTPTEFSLFDLALPAREWSEVQGPKPPTETTRPESSPAGCR